MHGKKEDTYIKRMAELLRQGATLTDLSCPACSSPLFRLEDGTLWCEKDEKKVIIVREGEKNPSSKSATAIETLEDTLMRKVEDIQTRMQRTDNIDELNKLSVTLSGLLESLEKIKRMKRS